MPTWRKMIAEIHRKELPFALAMFGYFFLVVTTFWILKPLKKAAFVGYYKDSGFALFGMQFTAAQAELWAKVANVGVAIAAVAIFSWLSERFVRQQLTYLFSTFFLAGFALYSLVLDSPHPLIIWSFYLFGDLFSTLMVATFFVFLNDSVTPESAKRLYGVIGLGGVLGGAFGSFVVNALVTRQAMAWNSWMGICFASTAMIIGLAALGARTALRHEQGGRTKPPRSHLPVPVTAAFGGAHLVLTAPYLLSIAAIVALYEVASSLLDFQFTATVLHFVARDNLDTVFSAAYVAMNATAAVVQLFLTSFVMRRLGLRVALTILPLAILTVSAGYLIAPILAVAFLMPTADGGFAYSINQSAKETLYVPTGHEVKYKAKVFIDMFMQRLAKLVGIAFGLIITLVFTDFRTFRWLTLLNIGVIALWLIAVRLAGTGFSTLVHSPRSQNAHPGPLERVRRATD